MKNKKTYWCILGLVVGVVIGLGISRILPSQNNPRLGAGFSFDLGPLGLDFGSRDYYYPCYYDEDGNYYCDGGYYYDPYYYNYYYYNYPPPRYYRHHHRYHHRH